MDNGNWVEPQPMATTSLRLPADVIDQLKQQARTRHVRYTTYVRSILERAARGGSPPELAEITERLDRIERALSGGHPHDDQKTALRTSVRAGTALLVSVVVVGVVAFRANAGHLGRFRADGLDVVEISAAEDGARATAEAIQGRPGVVYQGR